jgi:hypothetical protein
MLAITLSSLLMVCLIQVARLARSVGSTQVEPPVPWRVIETIRRDLSCGLRLQAQRDGITLQTLNALSPVDLSSRHAPVGVKYSVVNSNNVYGLVRTQVAVDGSDDLTLSEVVATQITAVELLNLDEADARQGWIAMPRHVSLSVRHAGATEPSKLEMLLR